MRKVYRNTATQAYWEKRWSNFDKDESTFTNLNIYPIKFTNDLMTSSRKALDIGCGLGRVVKHYFNKGHDIRGCDYSKTAVQKLNVTHPELNIIEADVTKLPYGNKEFDVIFAFGVFHGLEQIEHIKKGLEQSIRCLSPLGHFVVSVRADNLENWLIDYITAKRGAKGNKFHKWCFTRKEFTEILESLPITIESVEQITNVSFLHKFKIFRKNRALSEKKARSEGFKLNRFGKSLYYILKFIGGTSFGTTIVFTTRKKST